MLDHDAVPPLSAPLNGESPDRAAIWLTPETRQVLDSMKEYFVALDRDYNIVFVNRAIDEATATRHGSLLGKNHWDLWPDMRGTIVEDSYSKAFATGLPVQFEYYYQQSDSWVDVNAYPNGPYLHIYFRDISPQKRMEAEQRSREEQMEEILSSLPHIAWITDGQGNPLYLNERWRDYTGLSGLSRDEVISTIHPEDFPAVMKAGVAAREQRTSTSYRARIRRHDGEYRWYEVRAVAIEGRDGPRMIGTSTDVHEEHLAQERLAESEARYAAIFGESSVGMALANMDGRLIQANDRYCEITGRTREELLGLRFQDLTHEEDWARNLELLRTAQDDGKPFQIEKRYVRPDGSEVWVNNSVRVINDSEGRPAYVQAVTLDITHRKQTEEALRLSEQRFRAAVNAIGVLWTNSVEGRMEGEQPGWASLTGQAQAQYEGYGWASALHPDDAKPTLRAWKEAVRTRSTFVFEHRVLRHDGQWRHFAVRAIPVLEDGEVREWVGVHVDVTELHESEAKLTSIIESIGDPFFALDRDYNFVVFNKHAEEFLNTRRDTVLGRNAWETFPASLGTPLERCIRRAMETGMMQQEEVLSPATGKWVELRVYPWPDGVIIFERDTTERKRAQDALHESESRLRFALEAAKLGTWDFDAATGLTSYSPDVAPIFGFEKQPLTMGYEEFMTYLPAEDAELIDKAFQAHLERNEPYQVRCRVFGVDGKTRWAETRGAAVRDESGAPVRASGVVADITAQVEAEEKLRESEARLQHALGAAAAGVWHFDPEKQAGEWDATCYRLYGYHPSDGKPTFEMWTQRLHPDDRAASIAVIVKAVETGEPFRLEYRLLHPTLGQRWLVTTGGSIAGPGGLLTGITFDATEERARVAALEATLQVSQSLATKLEAERIVQLLTDASTSVIEADFGAFFSAEAHPEEERFGLFALSGAPREAFTNFPSVRNTPLFRPTFSGEGTVRSDDVTQDPRYRGMPKGHLGVKSYLAVTVRARDGEILGGLLFGHREPGRFTLEHERLVEAFAAQAAIAYENALLYRRLREANEELEQRVRERTAELETANEQLEGFTYHVSHDLRTPLRAIVATSRMVQEDFGPALNSEARALLGRQAEAANRLGQLIDDLLKLSRLSREEIVKQPVDLSKLARELEAEIRASYPDRAITMEVQPDLTANADPRLIRLALWNLIENAFKYSPSGGTIRFGHGEQGFFVSDEGIGMEERYLERIFEPFQRLHRDDEFSGTGIGLTNVRQVIARHGGKVWATSQKGEGSTFYFLLP